MSRARPPVASLGDGGRTVAVLSPHLDDAVLSLGAAIHAAAAEGTRVRIVTVLAGDPDSVEAPGDWDRRAGFRTAGEATRARRREDLVACSLVGAEPVWLTFTYHVPDALPDPDAAWKAIQGAVDDAAALLVPGFPLRNPAHSWLSNLVLERARAGVRVGLYLEQPYVSWRSREEPEPLEAAAPPAAGAVWSVILSARPHRRAKRAACRAYRSQLPLLRGRLRSLPVVWRVALYELRRGGESVAWLEELGP